MKNSSGGSRGGSRKGKGQGHGVQLPPAPFSGAAHDCNTMVDFVEPPTANISPRNRRMSLGTYPGKYYTNFLTQIMSAATAITSEEMKITLLCCFLFKVTLE